MEKDRKLYWLFATVVLLEVLNLIFKVANPYYFNLIILTTLTALTALLGKGLGIKIGWIVTLTILTLLLIGLLSFFVWN